MALDADLIYCDDVRIEGNGKHLIIGVYQSDLILNDPLPVALGLTLYVRIWGLGVGRHAIEFKIDMPGGEEAKTDQGQLDLHLNVPMLSLPVGPIPVTISKLGPISTKITIDGELIHREFLLNVVSNKPNAT